MKYEKKKQYHFQQHIGNNQIPVFLMHNPIKNAEFNKSFIYKKMMLTIIIVIFEKYNSTDMLKIINE